MTAPPTVRLLDTDVLIGVQRGHPPAVAWFASLVQRPVVPGLVLMELIQDAHSARQVQAVERLVRGLPLAWPSEADCRRALSDFRALHLSHSLGLLDSLIAATAIGLGATLCTFNVKHYGPVAGLATEQPYVR